MCWAVPPQDHGRRLTFWLLSFHCLFFPSAPLLDLEWYEKSEETHAPQIELLETTSTQEPPNPSEPFYPRNCMVPVVFPGPVSQEGCCRFTCELLKHIMYQRQQLPLPYEQLKHFYRKPSPQVQIKEENRLVSVIDQIDKAVAVIPRGALFKTPFGPIHVNRTFEGLSLSEAKKLSSYFHFREPVELKNKTLLEKADLDPSLDFMDSLEHDIPKGSWSIQMERGNALVVLRSLLWPGLTFFHAPRTKNYGYIYMGTGEKNIDLPFML
uniref:Radial spoke head protein 9 homolog n=1 Tax=Canis lupus familiaris TaxID=9615 RepID=A0A8C0MY09_CANLF